MSGQITVDYSELLETLQEKIDKEKKGCRRDDSVWWVFDSGFIIRSVEINLNKSNVELFCGNIQDLIKKSRTHKQT